MDDWAQFGTQLLGDVARQYAGFEWNSNPDVIKAKALAEGGYYQSGRPGTVAAPRGAITVTSDILILGALAALAMFALKD